MKKAAIFLHGNLTTISTVQDYVDSNTLVICADGGAEHAVAASLTPDVIIGDLDSISLSLKTKFEKSSTTFIKYPREKNFTDAELAIHYAIEQEAIVIYIFGLLGDRLDHMLANILFLSQLIHKSSITIIEGDQKISFIQDKQTFHGKKGDELSLIPLKEDCEGITTNGLYYPLDNDTLHYGSTRGISNVMTQETASVEVKKGVLIAIHRSKR